jgi:hypothetical protein
LESMANTQPQLQPGFLQTTGNDPFTKTATYLDCAAVLAPGVPKAKQPIPTTERLRYVLAMLIATQSFYI